MEKSHKALWTTAIATYGVGDVATTAYGLSLTGVNEAHPISEAILGTSGIVGMVAVKAGALTLLYSLYRLANDDYNIGVPLGITALGSAIVANNTSVILSATQ